MYRIGIDLGGTNIAVGIVDEKGVIIAKDSVKTKAPRAAEEIVKDAAECVKKLLRENKIEEGAVCGAGIGVPGAVDQRKGTVIYSNNLNFHNVELCKFLKEHTGFDFNIENDANAAALGEYVAGSGKDAENFVMLTLGTGIGGGIITGGKLYRGKTGAAEIGHMVIFGDGRQCSCGRRGCYEQYASATALIRQTKEAMEADKSSLMWQLCDNDINKASGKTAFIAMHKGDKAAKDVIDQYVRYLSIGVISVINIFQPDILSIGGGVSGAGDDIIVPLKKWVEKEDYARDISEKTDIKIALLGNDAGIIGAAFL